MDAQEDIIIHPRRGAKESEIPSEGLFLVTPVEARFGQDMYIGEGGKRQFLYHSGLAISTDGGKFIAGPAIGAPIAVMTMEKLIALGARKIVLFGWCGAIDPHLHVSDVIIGAQAISGEGTSRYYHPDDKIMPSPTIVSSLKNILLKNGVTCQEASVWSTDAPYREDRQYIEKLYHDVDVKCVDMEYSALCAVAAFRQIEFGAVFLVSDELYKEKWQAGFTSKEFRRKSEQIVKILAKK